MQTRENTQAGGTATFRLHRFALTALLALPCALARADPSAENGFYFGLTAGAALFDENRARTTTVNLDTGGLIGGQLGYRFGDWRFESEVEYLKYAGNSRIPSRNVEVNADISRVSGSFGLYRDWQISGYRPYLGAGAGIASVSAEGDFEGDDTAFLWRAEFGIEIPLSRDISLVPSYRYEQTDTDIGRLADPSVAHVFRIGLRF